MKTKKGYEVLCTGQEEVCLCQAVETGPTDECNAPRVDNNKCISNTAVYNKESINLNNPTNGQLIQMSDIHSTCFKFKCNCECKNNYRC